MDICDKILEDTTRASREVAREDVIKETLSPEEDAEVQAMLGQSTIDFTDQDRTVPAWLLRLKLVWGAYRITYFNSETRQKFVTDENWFIRYIDNRELNADRGLWSTEVTAINKMEWSREFRGVNGKAYVEKFMFDIELADEIKQALKRR